jgi:branched-chain amino acid transport system permease protein
VTNFLQLVVAGVALGFQYAVVALGFVIIFKATGVINFAQGGLVMLGAYLTYNAHVTWGIPFWPSVLIAVAATAAVGLVVERLILRRMIGKPPFALIMITIGLLFVIQELVSAIWGFDALNLGDPWGIRTVEVGDVVISVKDIWTVILATLVLLIFFAFFRFTSMGLAMRATAIDQEAALAQGMSAKRVFAVSWAFAGGVAAIGGVTLASGPGGLSPAVQFFALLAFPAIILGGLDSPGGAVVGGIIIGLSQTLTAGYQGDYAPWLGDNFQTVMPYVVMVIVLLVRPYGLFGTKEVKRI